MRSPVSLLLIGWLMLGVSMLLLGCAEDAEPNPEAPAETPVRIVFFGDSITEAGAEPGGYVRLVEDVLRERFPDRPIEVIGAGISGNKVPDLQARLERDVLAVDPTHVVIYIGINDVWHFYKFEDTTGTEPDVYEQGLGELVTAMQAAGAQVLVCTPSVIGEDPDSDDPANVTLEEYATLAREVARTTGAEVCDLRAAFAEHLRANNPADAYEGVLTTDGVHLNAAGNRFVADRVVDALVPML